MWTADVPLLNRTFTVDELRPQLRANDIDATVAVQTIPVEPETPELLQPAATDPQIAAVVVRVDLTAPDVAEPIARLRQLPGGTARVSRHGPGEHGRSDAAPHDADSSAAYSLATADETAAAVAHLASSSQDRRPARRRRSTAERRARACRLPLATCHLLLSETPAGSRHLPTG